MAAEEGPRPGLLILDMSNDQLKGVVYNKPAVIANIAQLAMSDFFHVCIDSKAEVPAFRAKQHGAQIVDELAAFEHLNQLPKKEDSALSNPKVLETFKNMGVTHVCVCGISTDTSIHATAKDLVDNGFEIFVVKDATTSKNGKFGHDKGLRKIQSDFGDKVVVGVDDLLGEEEAGAHTAAPAAKPSQPPAAAKPAYLSDGPVQRPAVDEKAEKARMTDAEKLAARKKAVDEARFAHIKKANEEALANADPKRAAEIQKDSIEAQKFAQNLPQNKRTPEAVALVPDGPAAAAAAPTDASSPPPAASPPASNNNAKAVPTKSAETAQQAKQEQQEVGCLCGMFGGRKLDDDGDAKSTAPPSQAAPAKADNQSAPAPAPAPKAATSPAPAPATKANPAQTPSQPAPSSGGLKDAPTPAPAATQPPSEPADSPEADPVSPSSTARGGAPMAIPPVPGTQPPSATAVPGGAAGQKTWIKPLPEGQKKTTYTPDGAVAQPLGVKKMVQGDDVQERIRGLQDGGISTVPVGPRKMKTPKIVTDTKESWDREGNITREITRYITEIDGTKRTEKEIVKIPAKK